MTRGSEPGPEVYPPSRPRLKVLTGLIFENDALRAETSGRAQSTQLRIRRARRHRIRNCGRVAIREEAEMAAIYTNRFAPAVRAAGRAAEQEAVGSDYGACGYLTLAQADELLDRLALTPADVLLDIGSGSGWPGLYLAGRSGCGVVITDLTVAGMAEARRRAADDGLAARASAVVASARRLPFRPDSFDAIVHADLLC